MALFFIIFCMCASQDEIDNEHKFVKVIYVNQKEIIYQDRESQDIEIDSKYGFLNPSK